MRLEAEVTELSVCDVWQKSYGNPSQLSQHFKLSHSNESFVCECGKQFSRADLLQMHQVITKTQKRFLTVNIVQKSLLGKVHSKIMFCYT